MCKRKEFEDVVYLNNKLKNDREVLITLKEELSSELGSVYQNIGTDMASLEGHYQKRLLLRERVYLEAIRQLVDKCNTDALACQRVVQTLLLERMALEEDVKLRDKAIADQKTLMEDLVSSDAARTEIITSLQSKNRDLEIQVDALSQEVERTRVDREDLTKKI